MSGREIAGRYVASRLAVGGRQENQGPPPTAYRLPPTHRLPAARCLLIAFLLLVSSAAFAAETLPFIEDDYAKAVARAKAKNVPIFVEAWAPW